MGELLGLFSFKLFPSSPVKRLKPLKGKLASLRCRVNVTLRDSDARMSRQPHNCKRIGSGFPQPRQKRVPQTVQHKFAGETDNLLTVHNRLTDLAVLVIEARNENGTVRRVSREDVGRDGVFLRANRTEDARDVKESARCAFWVLPMRTFTDPNLAAPTGWKRISSQRRFTSSPTLSPVSSKQGRRVPKIRVDCPMFCASEELV